MFSPQLLGQSETAKETPAPVIKKEKKEEGGESEESAKETEEPKKSPYTLEETSYEVTLQQAKGDSNQFAKYDKMDAPKDPQIGKAIREVASTLGLVEGAGREARIEKILRKMAEEEAANARRAQNDEGEYDFIPRDLNIDPAESLLNTGSKDKEEKN
ncbi:MAG: hypothetical protein ACK5LK_10925 [Chthoniobacterales bacterium]